MMAMDLERLRELLRHQMVYRDYIERLHDEAGLEEHSYELEMVAVGEIAEELRRAIRELADRESDRRWVIETWRHETQSAPATVGSGTGA